MRNKITIRKAGLTYILSVVCTLLSTAPTLAQAPAAHWSNFNEDASACACHLFARDVLRRERLNIFEDAESVLIAGNNQVIA